VDPRDLLLALLGRVPLPVADGLAGVVAWLWWWVLPVRRAEAVANLAAALPEAAPRVVLTRMMHDLVLGYFELLRYDRGAPDVRVDVEMEGVPPGSLLVAGHGGSWDLGLLACADRHPFAIFLKTPANRWVRERMAALRERHQVAMLLTGTRMEDAYRALTAGWSVCFVQDQHHPAGVPSPFFGRPARTSLGLASAVLRTGQPVYAGWPVRLGRGHHAVAFRPLPLPARTGDAEADLQAITDTVNRWYEERIRAAPHGWLWLHRRWKPGRDPVPRSGSASGG